MAAATPIARHFSRAVIFSSMVIFIASRSSSISTNHCFSRRFSCSSACSRLIPLAPTPPYFDLQRKKRFLFDQVLRKLGDLTFAEPHLVAAGQRALSGDSHRLCKRVRNITDEQTDGELASERISGW